MKRVSKFSLTNNERILKLLDRITELEHVMEQLNAILKALDECSQCPCREYHESLEDAALCMRRVLGNV